jgi:hypothetical protein
MFLVCIITENLNSFVDYQHFKNNLVNLSALFQKLKLSSL